MSLSPKVIAVCGKGGVGKTSISAMIAKILFDRGKARSLMVDGDHAGGLSMALGLKPKSTLNDIRKMTIERIQAGIGDKKDLAVSVDYMLFDALTEKGNLAFLSVGRPEEDGCYCSVHGLLKQAIEILSAKFDLTVIDAEAGIEQVNRKVMGSVDLILLISDGSAKSLNVAETIARVAQTISPKTETVLLFNRLRSHEEFDRVRRLTGLPAIGWLVEDETIRRFDSENRSLFELDSCRALLDLAAILHSLNF